MQGVKGDTGGWGHGTLLDPKTNLNTVRTPGIYTNGGAVTLEQNYPIPGVAGVTRVYTVANQGYLLQQEWLPNPHNQTVDKWGRGFYTRMINTESASPWRFIASQRVDNTAGKTIYTWDDTANREQLIYGDTGWRLIAQSALMNGFTGFCRIRRLGSAVYLQTEIGLPPIGGMNQAFYEAPEGFKYPFSSWIDNVAALTNRVAVVVTIRGTSTQLHISGAPDTIPSTVKMQNFLTWNTTQPWPTTLPGTPVGALTP